MQPILQVHQVSYSYPNRNHPALQNLSFSLHRGEFLGILGADESGKTTLAKLINGFIRPSSGSLTFSDPDGERVALDSDKGMKSVREQIGVVFADPENQIVGTTVEEDVAFGPENLRLPPQEIRTRIDHVLKLVGLSHYADRAPHQLSGGEQQKLCIAGIVAMKPDCLVLDEPLTFLDAASREDIFAVLRTLKHADKTIVYLTSDPEELLLADRIIVLRQGTKVCERTLPALWNHPETLRQADILPSDMLLFRHTLRQHGYDISDDSLTPETIHADICDNV